MVPSKTERGPFAVPRDVARLMAGFPRPWYVAGGWAIDLYLGRVTRPHEDVEIGILREDQQDLRRHLAGWAFEKVVPGPQGHRREPWPPSERLEPPVHEAYARRPRGTVREIEILLSEAGEGPWRFRRDPRVTKPLEDLGLVGLETIPFLSPDVVLLYKAKAPRPRDEEDFRNTRAA